MIQRKPVTSDAQGHVHPRYAAVADEFDQLLRGSGRYSSQLAVYWRGEPVVDLVGGPELPSDSIIGLSSATKGVAALCLAILAERGELDLDATVSRCWPEFARNGKASITVRQAPSHQAGLLGTASGLTTADFCSRRAAEKLARERPVWLPGSAFGYHRRTLGAIMEELALRITGITLQDFYEAEVRNPRSIDMFIGLPVDQEPRFVPTRYATGPSRPESGPRSGSGQAACSRSHSDKRSGYRPISRSCGGTVLSQTAASAAPGVWRASTRVSSTTWPVLVSSTPTRWPHSRSSRSSAPAW